VIGTASTANVDLVRSLGADEVVDYTTTPFESVAEDVDVVFTAVAGETVDRSWGVLKRGGILVSITGQPSEDAAREHGVRVGRVSPGTAPPDVMARVGDLLASGALRTVVRAVFPLEKAADAMRMSETGHGRGHIVVKVRD
jgi:NADPH:quinone reductase-like Zn-dependent oxidoreductase